MEWLEAQRAKLLGRLLVTLKIPVVTAALLHGIGFRKPPCEGPTLLRGIEEESDGHAEFQSQQSEEECGAVLGKSQRPVGMAAEYDRHFTVREIDGYPYGIDQCQAAREEGPPIVAGAHRRLGRCRGRLDIARRWLFHCALLCPIAGDSISPSVRAGCAAGSGRWPPAAPPRSTARCPASGGPGVAGSHTPAPGSARWRRPR